MAAPSALGHLAIALLVLLVPATPALPQTAASIEAISQQKDARAAALAAQAALCSSRTDTRHPAFRGCVDWHSAVHGVWALIAYQRATGNQTYAPLVAKILAEDRIEAERAFLRQSPGFEMPYGRAWFLRLAMDHRRLTGGAVLQDIADEVAASLGAYFRRAGIARDSTSYNSASWALINLLDYTRARNLDASEIEDWVKKEFVAADPRCPAHAELSHFMAVCTNRAALAARVMDKQQYAPWLDDYIRANGLPVPINPGAAHTYGLNFSRAWGLWDMYAKSGRRDVAEAYARHFNRGFSPEQNWRGDYYAVGHWVAQFGMFALQPLYGPEGGR